MDDNDSYWHSSAQNLGYEIIRSQPQKEFLIMLKKDALVIYLIVCAICCTCRNFRVAIEKYEVVYSASPAKFMQSIDNAMFSSKLRHLKPSHNVMPT